MIISPSTHIVEHISPAEILRFFVFVIVVCNMGGSHVACRMQWPPGRAPTCLEYRTTHSVVCTKCKFVCLLGASTVKCLTLQLSAISMNKKAVLSQRWPRDARYINWSNESLRRYGLSRILGGIRNPHFGGRGGRRGSPMAPFARAMVVSYRLSLWPLHYL